MQRIPFSPEEMTVVRTVPGGMPGAPATPFFKTPVTPLENYRLLMARQKPLWLHTMQDCLMLAPSVLPDNVARGMVCESKPFDLSRAGGRDMFGIEWEYVPAVMGSMVRPGHPAVEDINDWEKSIVFPDVDSWDWAEGAAQNRGYRPEGVPLITCVLTGLFERLVSFMDMENALIALVDEDQTEGVCRLFDRLCGLYDTLFRHLKQYYDIDIVNFHDDWGSQRAPLFSLRTCRQMLVPYLKRIVASAHRYGIAFDFHSCGYNEMLVPAMIEAGVDSWWGQPMNDKKKLYTLYGDQITLGVDLAVTPDSTPAEVRSAVDDLLASFPAGNVYVGMYMGPAGTRELLYEKSRRCLCG